MKTIVILLFSSLLLFGSYPGKDDNLRKVSFITHWLPQAQFAGYYMAVEKGIYKKYGIDLDIITGGPNKPSSEVIKNGGADFASLWLTNAIQLKAAGVNIVNIGQMINKSALMLVAKKSSGIKGPGDMERLKVGLWGGDFVLQPNAFFKKYKLNVKIIPQANSINLFLVNGVQVTSAMWYNEYHTIINSGYNEDELVTFFFSEHGLNFPEEGIYVTEEFYNKNTKLCHDFVRATVEGWYYAFNNVPEAIQVVQRHMRKVKVPNNLAHQKWMLNRFKDLMLDKKGKINTTLMESEFDFVAGMLIENGLIKTKPSFRSFYKNPGGK
ncbi:MAG: ABC transporter substrate-binding protein [Ignavibacteriaceae bacterium]